MKAATNFYELAAKTIDGKIMPFSELKGSLVYLIVNVASAWGLTKSNYTFFHQIYQEFHQKGLEILAFPCNQFGKQESGTL